MTKYEWERELKRNLARLPIDEQNRALAFYDELFADKAEQGYSEREVVKEFGNPFDVATAIIRDYETEHGAIASPPPSVPHPAPRYAEPFQTGRARQDNFDPDTGAPLRRPPHNAYNESNAVRRARQSGAAGALLRVLFFIPYTVLVIVMVSVLIAFTAAAVGCIGGGIVVAVMSFTTIATSGAVFAAELGSGLAAVAVGALFMIFVPVVYKAFKGISAAYLGIKRPGREVY